VGARGGGRPPGQDGRRKPGRSIHLRPVKNHVWGAHATEFLATGTVVRRLTDEHRLPETSPKPTFTLGLDN
jgi:hypothetical protein